MLAYILVHKDIAQDVVNALDFDTGEIVTTLARDPVFEERPILDEDGEPTGETIQAFVGFGEPYDIEVPLRAGGYVKIGRLGNWFCLLVASSTSRLQTINTQAGDQLVPLVSISYDENQEVRFNVRISSQVVSRINTFFTNQGLPTIPGTWTYGKVVTRIIQLFAGEKFDVRNFSILAAPDA